MLLWLRCSVCDEVYLSKQDTSELEDAESEDIYPEAFVCSLCEDRGEEAIKLGDIHAT